MALLKHELWQDADGLHTFCLAGPMGDEARALLSPEAKLVWTVCAGTHFEAMTAYYAYDNRGAYSSSEAWDYQPYPEEWLHLQQGAPSNMALNATIGRRRPPTA